MVGIIADSIHHASFVDDDPLLRRTVATARSFTEHLRLRANEFSLTLLHERTFSMKESVETREGVCRLMPPLTTILAEASTLVAKLTPPNAEQISNRLGRMVQEAGKPFTVPTLLTQSNWCEGRAAVHVDPPNSAKVERLSETTVCRECGLVLSDAMKHYCVDCLPTYRDAHTETFSAAWREDGGTAGIGQGSVERWEECRDPGSQDQTATAGLAGMGGRGRAG
jgi:hypothetical protein